MFQNFWIRGRMHVQQFFKFENPTPVQNPATIIDPTVIHPCFCLINDHADSCYCWNGKVTPDPGPVFPKFLTPDPGPKEKHRILLESTPALRFHSHLCLVVTRTQHYTRPICGVWTQVHTQKIFPAELLPLMAKYTLPYKSVKSHHNWHFDMIRIITSNQQNFSQSDPVLIHQFSKKLQSDPVLIRPKLASVLTQSDPILIRAHLC